MRRSDIDFLFWRRVIPILELLRVGQYVRASRHYTRVIQQLRSKSVRPSLRYFRLRLCTLSSLLSPKSVDYDQHCAWSCLRFSSLPPFG